MEKKSEASGGSGRNVMYMPLVALTERPATTLSACLVTPDRLYATEAAACPPIGAASGTPPRPGVIYKLSLGGVRQA